MMQFLCKRCANAHHDKLDAFERNFEEMKAAARKQSSAVAKLLDLLYLCEHAPYRRRDALEHTARVIDEFLRIVG